MDAANSRKTSVSKALRFLYKAMREVRRIAAMMYSLIFLKGVKPVPSTKQSGK